MSRNKWTDIIIELQSLAQAGLTYGRDDFDLERYARIRDIAAEVDSVIVVHDRERHNTPTTHTVSARYSSSVTSLAEASRKTSRPPALTGLQKTNFHPLAVAKNSEEQVRMCFEAYRAGGEWKVRFD